MNNPFNSEKDFYVVGIPNKQTKNVLYDLAKEAGIPVWEGAWDSNYGEYPNIVWSADFFRLSGNGISLYSIKERASKGLAGILSIDDFVRAVEDFKTTQKIFIPLTPDYTARMYYEEEIIEVGCQKISFDKVLEIAEAIKKSKSK